MQPHDLTSWMNHYRLLAGGGQDCCSIGSHSFGFATLAQAIDFGRSLGLGDWPVEHVWTITHGDGDEEDEDGDDPWVIAAGVHRVNVVAFVVTRKPHAGTEAIQW